MLAPELRTGYTGEPWTLTDINVYVQGFSGGSVVKNPPAGAGDTGLTPGLGKIPWRRKWQPTPGFLPGESHEQRSLAGWRPWEHKRVRHDAVTKQQHSNMYVHVCAYMLPRYRGLICV